MRSLPDSIVRLRPRCLAREPRLLGPVGRSSTFLHGLTVRTISGESLALLLFRTLTFVAVLYSQLGGVCSQCLAQVKEFRHQCRATSKTDRSITTGVPNLLLVAGQVFVCKFIAGRSQCGDQNDVEFKLSWM